MTSHPTYIYIPLWKDYNQKWRLYVLSLDKFTFHYGKIITPFCLVGRSFAYEFTFHYGKIIT